MKSAWNRTRYEFGNQSTPPQLHFPLLPITPRRPTQSPLQNSFHPVSPRFAVPGFNRTFPAVESNTDQTINQPTLRADAVNGQALVMLEGIPASPGIAVGTVHLLAPVGSAEAEERRIQEFEIEIEVERFHAAVGTADSALAQIEAMAREQVHDRAEIFEALRMMLHDPTLHSSICAAIRAHRQTASGAIRMEMTKLAAQFSASSNPTIRSRAEDVHSLQEHLIAALGSTPTAHPLHSGAILAARALSPGDTVLHARGGVGALLLEAGGINSHAAILARAFGLPMVVGIRDLFAQLQPGFGVIVDGYVGRVIINPDQATLQQYQMRNESLQAQRQRYRQIRDLPAETRDAERVTLAANLDLMEEIEGALENGAEEIGLMRTEYLAMHRVAQIGVEEQATAYRQIAERAYPMTVTFRLFDIGSDKLLGNAWSGDSSPLGLRGMRLLLAHQEILYRQLEALLRASEMKNIRVMLPMVGSIEEIRGVKRMVAEIKHQLRIQRVPFDEYLPIGGMIETPAAALIAETLASECAFLSIGTNDLAQYTLAVDRAQESVAAWYDEFHPAVLQLIRTSILAAHRVGVPITLCGEMAGNPLATGLLIGLGLRRFSVAPAQLGPLKLRVRSLSAAEARAWARAALRMPDPGQVRAYLASCMDGGDSEVELE